MEEASESNPGRQYEGTRLAYSRLVQHVKMSLMLTAPVGFIDVKKTIGWLGQVTCMSTSPSLELGFDQDWGEQKLTCSECVGLLGGKPEGCDASW